MIDIRKRSGFELMCFFRINIEKLEFSVGIDWSLFVIPYLINFFVKWKKINKNVRF